MSFMRRNSVAPAKTPFCKVCYDAKLSTDEFTSHFVKDQPGPNGRVVCPTLLAQKCLICGVPGHTSSYCPDNSSVSSSSTIQKEKESRFTMATDEIRYPPHSIRLPPIQKQPQQQQQQQPQYRPAPRIVYATELSNNKPVVDPRHEFPSLPNVCRLPAAAVAEASPVHSPAAPPSPSLKKIKVKYNRKSNPFGALDDNDDNDDNVDSGDDSYHETLPPVVQKLPSSSSSSWASIAAGSKTAIVAVAAPKQSQPQQQRARSRFSIVVPTTVSAGPLLPPISFKPKPVFASDLEKKQQVKKLWGDTDSEDDEEFLKRGVN